MIRIVVYDVMSTFRKKTHFRLSKCTSSSSSNVWTFWCRRYYFIFVDWRMLISLSSATATVKVISLAQKWCAFYEPHINFAVCLTASVTASESFGPYMKYHIKIIYHADSYMFHIDIVPFDCMQLTQFNNKSLAIFHSSIDNHRSFPCLLENENKNKIKINNHNDKNDRAIKAEIYIYYMGGEWLQRAIAPKSYSWTFCILINIFVALFNIYYVLRQLDLTYKCSLCAWQLISSPLAAFFIVLLRLPIRLLFQLHHHFIFVLTIFSLLAPAWWPWRCCFYSYKFYCHRNLSLWPFLFFLVSIINPSMCSVSALALVCLYVVYMISFSHNLHCQVG